MIRVIGIDIPRGWAVIDVGREIFAPPFTPIAVGELDEGREVDQFGELVQRYLINPKVAGSVPAFDSRVAIETPLEPYLFGRGSSGNGEGVRRSVIMSLMKCSRLAGRIEQQAIVLGLQVAVVDADEVRKALGIKGRTRTEKDQAVKAYVQTHVRGWPARSNADERDSAVVAIYGGMTK